MSQHTPAPWLRSEPSRNHIVENNEARSLIAVVSSWSQGGQQRTEAAEANARLIAAAPQMLDALLKVEELLRFGNGGLLCNSESHQAVLDAIAAALMKPEART